jgi:gluconokinase
MSSPLVVMGVSGAGKSTVASIVARRLNVPFADADDFHPSANISKMTASQALDDQDRVAWLQAIGEWLAAQQGFCVMSCSALKRSYRDRLRLHCPSIVFAHLSGSREIIAARQSNRPDHFMPASLLDTQFAVLEPLESDEIGATIDVDQNLELIIQECLRLVATESPEACRPA